jgi:hypothetical protein
MTAMVIFSCEPRILVHTRFGAPVLPPDGASFLSSIRQAAASHEQATSNFFVMPAGYDKILATCQGEYLFFSFPYQPLPKRKFLSPTHSELFGENCNFYGGN